MTDVPCSNSKYAHQDGEVKQLAKFYAEDTAPCKRLHALLTFLKNQSGNASGIGAITGTMQKSLSEEPKAAVSTTEDHDASLAAFWGDLTNPSTLFDVLNGIVSELETLYEPHHQHKKIVETEDWNELFEGLEVLIRNNIPLLHDGWKSRDFMLLFAKLLKRENHALIKTPAFRCLALYVDATRNIQQLVTLPPYGATTSVTLDDDSGTDDEENARATASTSTYRPHGTFHLELLRESVDFLPYASGGVQLPENFINGGIHVEGWIRPSPAQPAEPVDMLKFITDLSLEKEDPKILENTKLDLKTRGDRFEFWVDLILRFYMSLLYPKACIEAKLKEEGDGTGFFHHCPGSFQRVWARWIYKLRKKPDCMETLWFKRDARAVVMETLRQRFAYRDSDLVLDAIIFYTGICTGEQYVPQGMLTQIHETSCTMIRHLSQLFHPTVRLENPKILLNCIELLEVISRRPLDDYTSKYLHAFVTHALDRCMVLREPSNADILSAMTALKERINRLPSLRITEPVLVKGAVAAGKPL